MKNIILNIQKVHNISHVAKKTIVVLHVWYSQNGVRGCNPQENEINLASEMYILDILITNLCYSVFKLETHKIPGCPGQGLKSGIVPATP